MLQPFTIFTDALSGDKAVTITKVIPLLNLIQDLCKTDEDEDALSKSIKNAIENYISTRYAKHYYHTFKFQKLEIIL